MTVYINALGLNNALGSSTQQVFRQLQLNQSLGMQRYESLISGRRTMVARVVIELPTIPEPLAAYRSRANQMVLQAYLQMVDQVEAMKAQYGSHRIGVILGNTTSGVAESEKLQQQLGFGDDFHHQHSYLTEELQSCAQFLSAYADLSGPSLVISTACTSSGRAMIQGWRMLNAGLCDAVIVGGVDSLCGMTLNGFDSLESLEPGLTRPLSKNRQGINIGEGAALLLLSRDPAAVALLGFGESSDAYHISSPDPAGRGAIQVMQAALDMAGLCAEDIGYLNLHGTGTPKNDEMETLAVATVLPRVPVSSTKPLIGHTLGAASAQEVGLCYLLLTSPPGSQVPVHLYDQQPDERLAAVNRIDQPLAADFQYAMSNSFAFGGSNFSVVIGRSEHAANT